MFWEICHDVGGDIISSPYENGFIKMNDINSLLIYDINDSSSDWSGYGLEWVYERIQWCKENRMFISDVVYQDYVHPDDSSRRKRVYEFRFNKKADVVAFKLRWI